MRRIFMVLVLFGSLWLAGVARADGAAPAGRLVKVLPFLLNLKGNDSLSPSPFDQNSYQSYLRQHTNEVSGVRYDVQWKAARTADGVKVRLELKAVGPDGSPHFKTLEQAVTPGRYSRWTSFKLAGDDFVKLGPVVAWRATLWSGEQQLGEQKSFLW